MIAGFHLLHHGAWLPKFQKEIEQKKAPKLAHPGKIVIYKREPLIYSNTKFLNKKTPPSIVLNYPEAQK